MAVPGSRHFLTLPRPSPLDNMYHRITNCRGCTGHELQKILAFGRMPLADGLRTQASSASEPRFPLTLVHCHACSLVQIRENVDTRILFGASYPYYASFCESWVEHCRQNAIELIDSRRLNGSSQVVEIACNDGYMLQHFRKRGISVLGVDPAPGPASAARQTGIDVREEFFTAQLASELYQEGITADVVIANNVLAHVPNLRGLVDGIARVLKSDGVAVIECPYLGDLITHCEFDTIYHEHHSYFSVTALSNLFRDRNLSLNDVRRIPTHGGSLRLYVEHVPNVKESVYELLAEEAHRGMAHYEFYRDFATRVETIQRRLRKMLSELKASGKSIAGYAAAAKGAMLLNSSKIADETLDFVVDLNRHKHGRFMPGSRLRVGDTRLLLDEQPDYVLLLAWNHKTEILNQQAEYRRRGGKFIVPIPSPVVV